MLIEQRFSFDCAIAALAMYLGKPWQTVFDYFKNPTEAIPCNKSAEYLWKCGYYVEWFEGKMPIRRALVVVKSKNQDQKLHMLYFDGLNFFDPSPDKKYSSREEVELGLDGILEEPHDL